MSKLVKDGMNEIISLCKRRGFCFPCSEIYGGLQGSYDYGPMGVALKRNISDLWFRKFVRLQQGAVVNLDSSIVLSPKVWEASGHVEGFADPLSECKSCSKRFRTDHVIESITKAPLQNATSLTELKKAAQHLIDEQKFRCPSCGNASLGLPRNFNLLMTTQLGPLVDSSSTAYFRPETAQGAYVNVLNVLQSSRKTNLPFGIAQAGKVFRNEVTPSNFIFRTREFEQLELQWFRNPSSTTEDKKDHSYWVNYCLSFLIEGCGLNPARVRLKTQAKEDLAHYSKGTVDIEYLFPSFGWGEVCGIANRGNWDIRAHEAKANIKLWKDDNVEIIEPSMGLNRLFLAVICDAVATEEVNSSGDKRDVLKISPVLSPFEFAVFPVVTKNGELVAKAQEIYSKMLENTAKRVDIDLGSASVGKKYRRQDEIGTVFCVCVDDETLHNQTVSVRERDSMKQKRVKIEELFA